MDMIVDTPAAETDKPDSQLVKRLQKIIKSDRTYHEKAFERMRRDMFVTTHGRDTTWSEKNYTSNIAGRHVKQKTAALYAKNPKATARRRETLDFAIWDERPESLEAALMMLHQVMQLQQMAASMPPEVDPLTGALVPVQPPLPPGAVEAQELLADFQQGMEKRELIGKIGKTLEILFSQAMREQKPVDFRTGMKQCVRRGCTTGVGYVELGFQREYGPRPGLTQQLTDARTRLDHLRRLTKEAAEGEIDPDDPEMEELERSVAALQQEPEIVLREGLIFDFPQSTKVIPDKRCRSLVGFIGARHLTIEYLFTAAEVEEMFEGIDLKKDYTSYGPEGKLDSDTSANIVADEEENSTAERDAGMVCVWKHYDKPSGMVYYLADGHPNFLRPPAPPDVFVEDFWPVYALTFNAMENEKELFPPSDVTLILPMQEEYNRSRQGKREHRMAARPRWTWKEGGLQEEDIEQFKKAQPFDVFKTSIDPQTKLEDVLEIVPVPGVDPNLYDTNEIMSDLQVVAGTQEAIYGGLAKATATESAIAANSSASSDGSSIDDLDAFLTVIARSSGQILLKEMSEEKVRTVVGPGAMWPHMTLAQIADEIFLEVEAGSTGKPNQAVELNNWERAMPFLIQLPNIPPMWLAREYLRRLDDRMDLTGALTEGLPSIVAMNANKQPGTGDPATDPAAQGPEGGNNGPQPPGQTGSDPAFGSNQV
jgi:hypothetical protein